MAKEVAPIYIGLQRAWAKEEKAWGIYWEYPWFFAVHFLRVHLQPAEELSFLEDFLSDQ